MTTEAMIGSGTLVELSDGSSPSAYVPLGEVGDLDLASDQVDQVDVTHMQSGRRKEYIAGLIDGTEGSIPVNYVPDNVTDALVRDWISTGEQRNLRFTYPNLVTETFLAIGTGWRRSAPVGGKMAAVLSYKKSGDATFGVTS